VENSTPQPKEKPVPLPQASFKPADTLLPGDKVVNVEIDLSIPKDTSTLAQGPVSPQMAQNIHLLVQRVAQNPQNAQAWNTLGNLYWRVGRADYAVQCFEEVLQLQPSNQALKDWLEKYRAIRNNPATGKE
jgi:tetratricopeptide (TPR) repeat protein